MSEAYPSEGEIVLATVTKIQFHSVFCRLDEYNKSGMIHISEIAPGRIRNIGEYVKEGKSVVTKVLKIDKEKGHIDLSLRRVTEQQRKQKAAQLKQQQLVKKIVEKAAQELKVKPEDVEKELESSVLKEYDEVFDAFQEIVEGNTTLEKLGVKKKIADTLQSVVLDRIKPKVVSVKGEFSIQSYASSGVDDIHKAFKNAPKEVTVYYTGAGKYAVSISAGDYKAAEDQLKELTSQVEAAMGSEAIATFERTDR